MQEFRIRGYALRVTNKLGSKAERALVLMGLGSVIAALVMGGCMPASTPLPSPTDTPAPTTTPVPTATRVWFPPTNTPTPFPTLEIKPTEDYKTDLGEIIFSDYFSSAEDWQLSKTGAGSVALGKNELTIAIHEPQAYLSSERDQPVLSDFYAEIKANPTLCRGQDEYGMLFRVASSSDFYRFSLSCDGQVRVDRVIGGAASSPQPWTFSGVVPPGAPSISQIGVWASNEEMRFFVNDAYQFSINDPMLASGRLGVFARSAGELAVTVNFSDLVVRDIEE